MNKYILAGLLFMPLIFGSSRAQTSVVTGGVVVFEAEDYVESTTRPSHAWVLSTDVVGYGGSGFMYATPNVGSNITVNWTSNSPELKYAVRFATSGTHYVWVRGFAFNPNDDSIHVGINGNSAGASNMTWQVATNLWAWSNMTFAGVATLNVPSPTTHTINVWMREDGARIDRFAIAQRSDFKPLTGQAFHVPSTMDANLGGERMRHPSVIFTNTTVHLYNGNQDTGPGGNPGNQLQTGSRVHYRVNYTSDWRTTNMLFFGQGPSGFGSTNKYFRGILPAGAFQPGDVVEYYLRIAYDTHFTTYLFGNDNLSTKSEWESEAQNDPHAFTVKWPLPPAGEFLEITNTTPQGDVVARLYSGSGHLSVLGSDFQGNPLAERVDFSPMEAVIGGETYLVGEVLNYSYLTNGLEIIQRCAGTTVVSRLVFTGEGVVQYEVVHWGSLPVERTAVVAASDAGERVYGFGEKFNSFDQSGRNVRILTWDPPGEKGDLSYKVAPWFVSTKGYGFHLESSAESYFDMRAAYSDRWIASNLFPSLKFRVVFGPAMSNVIERYTAYAGRPALPPAWSFAPWMSSDIWRTGGEVRFLITKLRERNIPGSVLVFDSPWETSYNDFTWNMTQFGRAWTSAVPGEAAQNWPGFGSVNDMMTFLRTNGYKVICWMTPFINTNSNIEHTGDFGPGGVPGQNTGRASNYNFAAANDYFVRASVGGPPLVSPWWKGRGSPVDFTNPDAAQWLQLQLSNLVAESGGVIGGFKTDDGETGTFTDTFIPTTAVYFDGRTGVEMRNGYSVAYHRTVWNVLGTNGILFSRSGFTGTQAFPAYWAGDNEPNFGVANGLPTAIVAGQSAAMCGYSIWSHDIGGYQDGNHSSTPSNLFMRWTQFGAFSPLMQMHRQTGSGRQYPWSYGPQAESNYLYYARLHTALFPYRYSYARQSSENGMPIIRPLVLNYQDDPNTYGVNHTYLFGNEFLSAIIITNLAITRQVYLPAGEWIDFWSNTVHAGSQTITWTNADQAKFPLFVRRGSIIPMISTNVRTLVDGDYQGHANIETMTDELIFRVYPGPASTFTVYDGTYMTCETNQTVTTMTLTSGLRPITITALATEPFSVERDGIRMTRYNSASALEATDVGWWYDSVNKQVVIREANFSGTHRYDFGPDSAGDGISDSWRRYHYGDATSNALSCATCDSDGDGMTAWEEYHSGTDPQLASSAFKIMQSQAVSSTGAFHVVIAWPGVSGFTYSLGWNNVLSNEMPWQYIPTVFTGMDQVIYWADDGSLTGVGPDQSPSSQRYYRVRTP